MVINEVTFALGDTISFTTDHATDTNEYVGTILAFCKLAAARAWTDVAAYEAQCDPDSERVNPPALEAMDFVVVELENGQIDAFSTTCMTTTPELVDAGSVTLTVYGTDTELATAIAMLRSAGYTVVQET